MAAPFQTMPTIAFLNNLPDISMFYFSAPWLFDFIILSSTLVTVFRYASNIVFREREDHILDTRTGRRSYKNKIGAVMGGSSALLITVAMQAAGKTLLDYIGPFIGLFILLFGISLYRFLHGWLVLPNETNSTLMHAIAIFLSSTFTLILLSIILGSMFAIPQVFKEYIALIFWLMVMASLMAIISAIWLDHTGTPQTPTPPSTPETPPSTPPQTPTPPSTPETPPSTPPQTPTPPPTPETPPSTPPQTPQTPDTRELQAMLDNANTQIGVLRAILGI